MNTLTKIYFAPFQGITTNTFQAVYSKHFNGVDKLFTPFFRSVLDGEKIDKKILLALKSQSENGIESIPQLLSKEAREIILFAKKCQELGFKELNWNLGCPHPQVANKQLGSGLLPYPEVLNEILQKVFAEIQIPFSIKCRLGYASEIEIEKLVAVFNTYPIKELSIHARTGKQMYGGQANPHAFKQIAPQFKMPLVYNGDIFTLEDFQNFKLVYPEGNAIMLGRGILRDPFLPAKIKGLTLPENPKAHLKFFIDDLYYAYRKAKNDNLSLLSALKEYWSYLALGFEEPLLINRKLKKVKRFEPYEDAVNDIFAKHDLI